MTSGGGGGLAEDLHPLRNLADEILKSQYPLRASVMEVDIYRCPRTNNNLVPALLFTFLTPAVFQTRNHPSVQPFLVQETYEEAYSSGRT